MVELVGGAAALAAPGKPRAEWAGALRHLRRDPVLKRVIRQIGPCTLEPVPREPYEALVRAIAHQQVHGRAAEAILGRFLALFPGHDFPPPGLVLAMAPEAMRACGFSGSKVAAIRDIAEKSAGGLVPTREGCAGLSDTALIERLVAIRGVGRWTVEMLLIFTLGRPDVLPVDDFGVREGWRVAAAWYLWRAADAAKRSVFKPQ
jgi:DNA-3-methyladenine glycosylase II